MNKTVRYIMYALISAICIIAIFVGVYSQFFKKVSDKNSTESNLTITNSMNDEQSEIKDAFKDLFANEFFGTGYDTTNIKKYDQSKELVYDAISTAKEEEGKYKITVDVPIINIDSEITSKYNSTTQEIFLNKINEIVKSTEKYTICDISFTAYINNDILSVAIMESLKEGDSAQRLIVQTYNYNLKTGKNMTISDILTNRELDTTAVNKKINSVVKKAASDASSVSQSGYEVYQRDLTDEMYDVKNVTNFIQGPNGELYIIYAYGNNNSTSEMDVIAI